MSNLTAGIIIIGDEILSGRTKDSNANYISKELIKVGIKLCEIRVISDESKIIISTVVDFHKKFTYVFTTGGIGPTHDDITSISIAKAFKRKYKIDRRALKILKEYYPKEKLNEGRIKMAKIPTDCELILNPLTAAPGFKLKNIYVLPGVPKIMQTMFPSILNNLKISDPIISMTVHTNLFESIIAKNLEEIQKKFEDCEIGSYPNFDYKGNIGSIGGVNIVVSGKNNLSIKNAKDEIIMAIKKMGGKTTFKE